MVVDQLRDATSCLHNLLATFESLQEADVLDASSLKDQIRTLEAQALERSSEITRLRQQVYDLQEELRSIKEIQVHSVDAHVDAAVPEPILSDVEPLGDVSRNHADTIPSPKSPHGRTGCQFEDDSSDDDDDGNAVTPAQVATTDSTSVVRHRASFSLVLRGDNVQDEFVPPHRTIRTKCHAKNSVQMKWTRASGPKTILLVKKPNEPDVAQKMREVAAWLMQDRGIRVLLEPKVHAEECLVGASTWTDADDWQVKQHEIDLVVSFGGDGTVLWVSSLFKTNVPPVCSFAMGSLGFLTPFEVSNNEGSRFQDHLGRLIRGGFNLSLRHRLVCAVVRAPGSRGLPVPPVHALNEAVVDRGVGAALVELDCYCDDVALTKISADGIIIASPTGSTAYSLSAGGSITHPSVPSMLFTPICPHTLSFRPLLFHDSAVLRIVVPTTARSPSVTVSFDGKNPVELFRGDALEVRVSPFPLPSVCNLNENEDWFESVKNNLYWNQRKEIKPFHAATPPAI